MSYTAGSLISAPNLQQSIFSVFETAPAVDSTKPVTHLQWTYSPINRGGLEVQVSPGRGKIRTVEVTYMADLNDNDILSDQSNPVCTGGTVEADRSQLYQIDTTENRQVKKGFSRTDLESSLKDNPMYMEELLMKMMLQIERAVAEKTATELVTLKGEWSDEVTSGGYTVTSTYLEVETLQASSNYALAPFGMQIIQDALALNGNNGTPFIFGGNALANYYRRLIAGGSADHGTDLGRMAELYGIAAVHDPFVRAALADNNKSLAIMPGVTQLLTYTATEWREGMPLVIEGSNYAQRRLVTPRVGLPVDVTVSDNCGTVTISVTATTKLVGLPTDLFNANNEYDGVTFVNGIIVANS